MEQQKRREATAALVGFGAGTIYTVALGILAVVLTIPENRERTQRIIDRAEAVRKDTRTRAKEIGRDLGKRAREKLGDLRDRLRYGSAH